VCPPVHRLGMARRQRRTRRPPSQRPSRFRTHRNCLRPKAGHPVIPVLVRGVKMPSAEQLPDELKELAYRQLHRVDATPVGAPTFSYSPNPYWRLLGDTGPVRAPKPTSNSASTASPGTQTINEVAGRQPHANRSRRPTACHPGSRSAYLDQLPGW